MDPELRKQQPGFRKKRGWSDQIFALRNIMEQCTDWQRQLRVKFVHFKEVMETAFGTYYTCSVSRSEINESVSLRASTTVEWGESISIRIPFWWWPGAAISRPSAWVREYNQSLWPRWTDRPEDQQKEHGGNDSERKSEQTERIFQQRINLHTCAAQTDVLEKNARTLITTLAWREKLSEYSRIHWGSSSTASRSR